MRPNPAYRQLLLYVMIVSSSVLTGSHLIADTYEDSIKKAYDLLNANNYVEANAAAQAAVQIDSARWEAYYVQGLAAYKVDMLDLAEASFKRALEHTPKEQKTQIEELLGLVNDKREFLVHVNAGKEAEAQILYGKAASEYYLGWKLIKQREEVGLRAAQIWANQLDDPQTAIRILTYILIHPQDPTIKEAANLLFKKIKPSVQNIVEQEIARGRRLLETDHNGKSAIVYLSSAAELMGADSEPHLLLARAYALSSDSEGAIAELTIARKLKPTKAEEILKWNEFAVLGDNAKFVTYVIDSFGDDAFVEFNRTVLAPWYFKHGCDNFDSGKLGEAIELFIKADETGFPPPQLHFLLARAYARYWDIEHTVAELRLTGVAEQAKASDHIEFIALHDDPTFSSYIGESLNSEARKSFEATARLYKYALDVRRGHELMDAGSTNDAIGLFKKVNQQTHTGDSTKDAPTDTAELQLLIARAEAKMKNADAVMASLRADPNVRALTPTKVLAEREFDTFKHSDVFLPFVSAVFGEAARTQFQNGMTWENTLGMRFIPVEVRGTPTKKRHHRKGVTAPGSTRQLMVGVYEVRRRDYAQFVAATGYNKGLKSDLWDQPGPETSPDHPVTHVGLEDCHAFCKWLSNKEGLTYRLLTDREWSCAAGIGDTENDRAEPMALGINPSKIYSWGKDWPPPRDSENLKGLEFGMTALGYRQLIEQFCDGYKYTAPVGSFRANAQGLHDFGGNVSEWCETWESKSPHYRLIFPAARGASWNDTEAALGRRYSHSKDDRVGWLGFRCAVEGVAFPRQ